MKKEVIKILKKALSKKKIKLTEQEISNLLEVPPNPDMGDYAFPCFSFSEILHESPHEVALELRREIGNFPETEFEDIQTQGPYINFFFNRKDLARKVVWEVINKKEAYGTSNFGKQNKILVEFSSPNIAKPFGIGHLRSTIIGNVISNICESQGFKVKRINYLGDWGTQFGKIILGFEKFGSEEKLEKDPINHLLEIYVKINKNKKYEKEAREWFKKLEQKDHKAGSLWRAFRELSLEEFTQLYKKLGIKFDIYDGESNYQKQMQQVIKDLQEKKLLKKSQGALVIDLTQYDLGVCLIQKSDGTTLYSTRELAAAISRYKQHKFFSMIYEVGQEQKLHFKQIFKILELMGYSWAKNCIHVEHGLYLDKDGKKFATRTGKTIFMKDILENTINLAKKEILQRDKKLSKEELEKRANEIAIAAIFYGDLKNNRKNNMIFDLQRFVSFEGDTGPYILYSYARASSILRKSQNNDKFQIFDLEQKEIELVKKLLLFPEVVLNSYKTLNPSLIANYSYQVSKLFSEFYHSCPVIDSKQESFRLALVEAFRQVLRNALNLLGIKPLEEM